MASNDGDTLVSALRAHGMTYPGAHVKSPWPEHLDLAVKEKTFAFLPAPGQAFHVTLKLPFTGEGVRERQGAAPTGYGLGRSGWVTLTDPASVTLDELKDWLDESYRAVAPKTLVKQLGVKLLGAG
jgi:predicted DNA-binding protein (MmcQ/YjbR family)